MARRRYRPGITIPNILELIRAGSEDRRFYIYPGDRPLSWAWVSQQPLAHLIRMCFAGNVRLAERVEQMEQGGTP